MILALLAAASALAATPKDTTNTVRFTPTIRLYECPPGFKLRSECSVKEKTLDSQKLELTVQVLTNRMGQWTYDATSPVPVSFFVIVVRGPVAGHFEYSLSAETGMPGSPSPFANARVEFADGAIPPSFSLSSSTMEKDGKKYLTEIRIADFHPVTAKKR